MLRELASSLLTRCPAPARRLGYAHEAAAIAARARRCAQAWAPHLARTRAAILREARACRTRRTVLVLGSGPLLDVPLAELAGLFGRVVLADLAHPLSARRAAARHPNVALSTLDLTGTVEALAAGGAAAPTPGCAAFLDDPGIDLVVSANLASQLPLRPMAALADEAARPSFAASVMAAHLDHLSRFRGRVLLVTDIERLYTAGDGTVLEREDPLFGAVPPPAGEEWDWTLAPEGEAGCGYAVRTRVRAAVLNEGSGPV
ncbi:MAG TPA: hypothetical protein VEB20_18075 [Azospirillaceae bacterium]|nr:hypothetical protein [Azospirillaceae bacterium]